MKPKSQSTQRKHSHALPLVDLTAFGQVGTGNEYLQLYWCFDEV